MSEIKIVRNLLGEYELYEGDSRIGKLDKSVITERKLLVKKPSRFPPEQEYELTMLKNNRKYTVPESSIKGYEREFKRRKVKYTKRKIKM